MRKELIQQEVKDVSLFTVPKGEEEQFRQEELELPFLRVAQKGSPQVDEDKPEYIEGLKPGQYFNTVSSENYGDTLVVQVHGYYQSFIIWKGEKGAGEFAGVMTPEEFRAFETTNQLRRDGGDFVHLVDGEELRYSDTRNFIVSLPEYESEGIVIYPMASTGIKAARKWNTLQNNRLLNGERTKRYATIWEIKTSGFEKDGWSWKQTSSIKPIGWATAELALLGQGFEEFVKSIKEQGVKYQNESGVIEVSEESEF